MFDLFNTDGFLSRDECGPWTEEMKLVYILANSSIALSYFAISFSLLFLYFKKRILVRYTWILVLFLLFTSICGVGHINDCLSFAWPAYIWFTFINILTGILSVATAIILPYLVKQGFGYRSSAEVEVMIDMSFHACVGVDEKGKIILWNKKAEQSFGWTKKEVYGKDLTKILIPERFVDRHNESFKRFVTTGTSNIQGKMLQLSALHKLGHEVPVEISITSFRHITSGWRFYAFISDITERKQKEDADQHHREQLQSRCNRMEEIIDSRLWYVEGRGAISDLKQLIGDLRSK